MMADPDALLRILPIAIAAAALAWNVVQYRLGARKAELAKLGERIEQVANDLGDHKEAGQASRAELRERLGHVEQTLKQMPDKESVHGLALSVTEIRGDIRTQGETLKAVAATARRVEEFLLDAAKESRR